MASKAQMQKFNNKVEKIVLLLGGVPTNLYRWVIETKAGKLFVTVHEAEASKLFSIFCCFDDEKLANETLPLDCRRNLNECSGKWNFYSQNENDCLNSFQDSLEKIETSTEIANLYDLRIPFSSELSGEERISRAIRDCFNRHKGKLKKSLMDETIKAVGKNTPLYKKVWADFRKTFDIKAAGGEYINPYFID
jgi:hypothetical protein